jgi:cytochrome c
MGPKVYATVLVLALFAGGAHAAAIDPNMGGPGNAAHGEVLFKQRCSVCHQPDPGGKNGVGPALYGAYGRRAGQAPGFAYSDNLKASGLVWTPQLLNQWIQKPSSLVPGAKMNLAPVSAAQDRADIIAYLATKSTNVVPAAPGTKSPHQQHEEREHGAKHRARTTKS